MCNTLTDRIIGICHFTDSLSLYRFNGHHIMKLFLLAQVPIDVYMFGILVKLVKNNQLRMLKMDHRNYCSFMVDIQRKFQIFHGIQMMHGLFVPYLKIIYYKCGKWYVFSYCEDLSSL